MKSCLLYIVVIGMLFACKIVKQEVDYCTVPLPQEIIPLQEAPFLLTDGVEIHCLETNGQMIRNAQFLAEYLHKATQYDFPIKYGSTGRRAITLELDSISSITGSYSIHVSKDKVQITASTEAGIFYAIQTLRKSLPINAKGIITLPAATINDAPRFDYRGAHLDVCRHFFTVEEVKTYIDMMALHHMNYLHWHLTDDQGWRLEIKKYPKLTKIGSYRKETVIGHNSGKYDGISHCGFYTQEQIREIVTYAAERFITIIPEIDLPGHMQAALASYPELGCTGGPYEVWTKWGISDNLLCAGNDQTLRFLEGVFAEVVDLFPSTYIHIGGDECPKTQWQKCSKCQFRIQTLGLQTDTKCTKEERLQSFLVTHIEDFLRTYNRRIIGWDEILDGGLSPFATVMSWRGERGGIEAAKQQHEVILTPNTYLYFDYYQAAAIFPEPLSIGGYLPIDRVYKYNPGSDFTLEEQKYIKGVQGNLWTEFIPTFSQLQYMALPRWAALCEIQWMQAGAKEYDDFFKRLFRLLALYDAEGYNYAKHLFNVCAQFNVDIPRQMLEVKLSTIDDSPVYYTLDGSIPTIQSSRYKTPITINKDTQLKAKVIRAHVDSKLLSENISFNKATLKPVILYQPVCDTYSLGGANALVDGLKGGEDYRTERWVGFSNNGLDATIDLMQPTQVESVSISVYVSCHSWLGELFFDTRGFKVQISDDGENYFTVASELYQPLKENTAKGIHTHTLSFFPVTTRYVRVVMSCENSIPAWHESRGKSAYLLVDEVAIY